MAESHDTIRYLIFDVEAVADGELVSRVRYPKESLLPADAVKRFRDEQMAEKGNDFLPFTFMLPISVAIAKVDAGYRLCDLTVLDEPEFRPHEITRRFWQGWTHYRQPTFVTFNGRGYDLPVLELAAYRYGINLAKWFAVDGRSYDQPRNRYNIEAHTDLMDLVSNFGATRVAGGLNLLANLIGKPGKTGVDGSQVQGMYEAGKVDEINNYCRCDVLDTYFVFLRSRVLLGKLSLEEEHTIVLDTKSWLEKQAETHPVYQHYLSHWGDWSPPA
ncbi:MAG: 3'-5' exonuclease [Planctomycetota bacterium]|nr:3'-5' exonuclease [Planctomycetota bacterium]MDA1212215.1 3'-5' exonuclease [Planctomycetota bacterium]